MNQRSQPYFFAFETKTKPGYIIGHCVRFETVEISSAGFDQTVFTLLGADIENDPRIQKMVDCVKGSTY